jgi:hypothetical protein
MAHQQAIKYIRQKKALIEGCSIEYCKITPFGPIEEDKKIVAKNPLPVSKSWIETQAKSKIDFDS